jgi:hypothetical protein
MRKLCLIAAFAALAAGVLTPAAFAQATATATVEGTVTDKTGAVIPKATVKLTNEATGFVREKTTSDVGLYRFDLVPAGMYNLRVSAPGFASLNFEKVELAIARTTTLDASLSPSQQAETITVEATGAPLVDTTKTDVSLAIRPNDVIELPLNGRDFNTLALLAPGAKPVDSYDPTKNRVGVFGVNGSGGRNVNVTVNGIDNKDNTVGGPVMQFPLEAIQEFNISTQRFSAANGRSEGAAVNVVTKSGSNQYHGSAFYFFRDKALNTLNYFEKAENGGTNEKSPFRRHQVGGTIGGPIVKDKLFFFFAMERQIEDTSISANPQAFTELNLVRNLGAEPATIIPTPYRDWRYNGRVDYRINEKHNIFASYNAQFNNGENDQTDENTDLTGGNTTVNELLLGNLTLNSVLTPTIVNSFTAGYQYWNNLIDAKVFRPNLQFPGGINFGTNVNVPQQSYQAKWQFRDDLSIVRGKHALRMGFDFVYQPKLGGFFVFDATPVYTFFDLPSVILNNRTRYPQGFATPGAVSAIAATAGDPYFNLEGGAKMAGVYFQDDWKVTKRLTINVGLRWDKDINLLGARQQENNRTFQALKRIGHPFGQELPQDYNLGLSPRFGFAFDVTGSGRHIVRGGYGLYYGQTFLNIPLFMIQQANPTLFAQVVGPVSSGAGDPNSDIVPGSGGIRLGNWRFGVDRLVVPPPATAFSGGEIGRLVHPDYRPPYTQQFNVGYAFQINQNNVIEIEGVRTLGLHESKTVPINVRRGGTARDLDAAFRAAGLPLLGRIDVVRSIGRSWYHGLNISYRRRLSNRFSVNTNYVLSEAKAYNGGPAAFGNRPTDINNVFARHDLGYSPNDERHRWVVSGIVQAPWGFQLAPIMQWASARPYNLTQGIADVFGFGGGQGATHAVLRRDNPDNVQATAALTAAQLRAGIADGSLYQAPFNAARGTMFFQLDLRASKFINFGDRARVEMFFQAFNLTNRANFGNNFVGNIRSGAFGQPNGFITPSGVIIPKSFSGEFGARFSF